MTECISNEKERRNHNIPTNIYGIIEPEFQLENVMSLLRSIKMEKYIQEKHKQIVVTSPLYYIVIKLLPKTSKI